MTLITLRHTDILHDGAVAHVSRVILNNKRPKSLHNHDFYEILWVQNGRIRHVTSDGHQNLTEGDMLFVQPDHAHALQGQGEAAMIVSVTLHPDTIAKLGRDFPELRGRLLWSADTIPIIIHRDSLQLATANRAAIVLEQSAANTLHANAFMLQICTALVDDCGLSSDAPDWLRNACLAAKTPAVFQQGAAGLVASAGKAHAHVTRTLKKYSGETPASYTNAIRMRHAASALTGGSEPLSEIAAEIGIPNLSHFHKQFRAFYGTSPAQYRAAKQRHVVQPE